jgi:hypothetical protein
MTELDEEACAHALGYLAAYLLRVTERGVGSDELSSLSLAPAPLPVPSLSDASDAGGSTSSCGRS